MKNLKSGGGNSHHFFLKTKEKYSISKIIICLLLFWAFSVSSLSFQNKVYAQTNLMTDASFETTSTPNWYNPWAFYTNSGYTATLTQDSTTAIDGKYSAKIDVSASLGADNQIKVEQNTNSTLSSGTEYLVSFYAKAASARTMKTQFTNITATTIDIDQVQNVTTNWQEFSYLLTPASTSAYKMDFEFGGSTGTINLDDLKVIASAGLPRIEQQINLKDQITTSPTNTGLVYVDPEKYTGGMFYFEITAYVPSGSGTVTLTYGAGTGVVASGGSTITITGITASSYTRYRSDLIPMKAGNVYVSAYSGSATVGATRLIIEQINPAALLKTQTQIEVGGWGGHESTTGTSYIPEAYPKFYKYDSSKFDGTVTIYFEANQLDGTGNGTVALYEAGTSCTTQVSGSDVASTGQTAQERNRSSSLTLTSGTSYMACYKSNDGTSEALISAKIIIEQSQTSGITKVQMYHYVDPMSLTTSSTSYQSMNDFQNQYNPDDWTGGTFSYSFSAMLKATNGSSYSQLYNDSDSAAISSSQVSMTGANDALEQSGSITMPTSAKEMDGQYKTSTYQQSVSYDAASNSSTGFSAGTSVTWNHTIGTNSNEVLMVSTDESVGQSISSVTYNGTSLTSLDTQDSPTTEQIYGAHEEVWYLLNPTSGTHAIVVTPSASAFVAATAVSFYDVDQTTPFGTDAKGAASNANGIATVNMTTTNTQMVFGSLATDASPSSPTSGQTVVATETGGGGDQVTSAYQAGINGSSAMTWNANYLDWSEILVPLNPSTANGTMVVNGAWYTIDVSGLPNGLPLSAPGTLYQFKADGTTQVSNGGWSSDGVSTNMIFTFEMTSPLNADSLTPKIEVEPNGTSFTGTPNYTGTTLSYSGAPVTGTVTVTGLTNCSGYHWEAFTASASGISSPTVFNTTNPNFKVENTAPTASTIYDGSVAATETTTTSTITSLQGNWAAFTDACSNLQTTPYQVAIGTIPGGTDIENYTSTGITLASPNTMTESGLPLHTSQTYYISIKATNNAGVSMIGSSLGITIVPSFTMDISNKLNNLGDVNTGNGLTSSGTSTLSVSSNSYNGYSIRAYEKTPFTMVSNSSITVPDYAGTYTTPTTWSSGQYGFGYTSSWGTQFSSGTKYAAFPQLGPGDIVAENNMLTTGANFVPGTPDIYTLTYKVAVSATQPSGTYSAQIYYIAAPTY